MPCNDKNYHPEWKSIARQIKDQAGDACEFCGVPNKVWVVRDRDGDWRVDTSLGTCDAVIVWGLPSRRGPTRVVLTVAHLDHDTTNNDPMNLRALCQQCHLRWDAPYHARNAAKTRRQKRIAAGQVEMPAVTP